MTPIKAIISDMDDTLLTEHHEMTNRTVAALQRVLAQGVKVVLASGRAAASMRPFVQRIGTPFPYIAYNGAQILDAKTDEVLIANEIPLALAKEVLQWFEARNVHMHYYYGDDWFYAEHSSLADDYSRSTGVTGTEVGTLSAHISHDVPKLLGIDEPERVQALIAESRAVFGDQLSITTSKPYFIEITSPKATKGNAVAALAERLGLTPDDTICAGDSLNDLSMLHWSNLPVTVANGRDELKQIAWRVAGPGQRDGIADLLDELIPEV